MKKTMMTVMLLAVLCAAMTNCKHEDMFDPEHQKAAIIQEYSARFLDYVGVNVSPRQDWGFGVSRLRVQGTRGYSADSGYYLANGYIKEFSKDYYDAALQLLPEGQRLSAAVCANYEFEQRGPFRFDLVFTETSEDNLQVGYYYYDPRTQTAADRQEVVLIDALSRDLSDSAYFQYTTYSSPTDTQWITPEAWYGYSIWTMKAKVYKVHSRMFTIETRKVPVGCRVGFFVANNGRKYYTNKYLNSDEGPFFAVLDETSGILSHSYVVGIEDLSASKADNDCNDLMIAVHKDIEVNPDTFPLLVVPEQPADPYTRIIAEDLNAVSDNSDFDFNDIVLDVRITATGADCILQAAGATLPIRINGDDQLEVHRLFNVAQNVMVNTHATERGLKNGATCEPVTFTLTGQFETAADIQIEVNKGTVESPLWITLFANRGEPACKIAVDDTVVWPDERVSIKDVYPHFPEWVGNPTVKWY